MAIKELQTRIALKYDLYSAWTSAPGKDLVLLKGELGICEIPSANADSRVAPTVLFKVGDGSKTFEKLPWASAKAADVYSWAKASEVKRDGKKLVFVGGAADGSNLEVAFDYVTLAEVETITNGLASRISALETSVGANGDIGKTVADHETRLDKLEGTDTDEGSVANALKVAKDYTDTREVEIKKYADQAETDAVATAKGYTDTEVKKVADALDLDEAALEAHITDKNNPHAVTAEQIGLGNVENKSVATIKSELGANGTIEANKTGFATGGAVYTAIEAAKTAANTYADGLNTAMDTRVDALEAAKTAQDTKNGELTQAIADEATARENADKDITDTLGTGFDKGDNTVAKKIAAAQTAAEANAATTAQSKVDALANGQVETNRAAIAAMDTAYKAADTTLGNRITTIEGKLADVANVMDFVGARTVTVDTETKVITVVANEGETFNKGDVAVDGTGKEYVYDGSTWHEFGYADSNTAAINDLQGRMSTAEGDIDNLEAAVAAKLTTADFDTWKQGHENDHANKQTAITEAINAVSDELSSHTHSYNDLTDKPFYDNSIHIEVDEEKLDEYEKGRYYKTNYGGNVNFIKVSDEVFKEGQKITYRFFYGGASSGTYTETGTLRKVAGPELVYVDGAVSIPCEDTGNHMIMSCSSAGSFKINDNPAWNHAEVTIPSPGTYVVFQDDNKVYWIESTDRKTLDEKFLPDSVITSEKLETALDPLSYRITNVENRSNTLSNSINVNTNEINILKDTVSTVESQLAIHSHSYNDLIDRPFGDETRNSIVIDRNGDSGVIVFEGDALRLIKASDKVLTIDMLNSSLVCTYHCYDEENGEDFTDETIVYEKEQLTQLDTLMYPSAGGWYVVSGKAGTTTIDLYGSQYEVTLPSDGTYFLDRCRGVIVVGIEFTTAMKTLDEKYLPDTIARTAALEEVAGKAESLETKAAAAEANITTLQGIVSTGANANDKLRTDIAELQGIARDGADKNAALRTDLTTLQGIVNHSTTGLAATKAIADAAKTKAEDAQARVEAIEADYLTSKDELIFNCGTSTTVVHEA